MELQIDHISKSFKDKRAVDGVSMTLTPGVWGLLGANGAGKTTLMRMIAGIMEPDAGQIRYDGLPIGTLKGRYREIFGYLPQEFGFYPEFTVKDYLEYAAALKGLPVRDTKRRIMELLEMLSLSDVYRKKIVKLSGGMKRRVGIAQALLNEPELLIMDEPTSGLDPGERVRFRNLLSEFAKDRIVLISTHIVSDVEYIATRNAVMKDGGLIAEGTTEELVKLVDGKVWQCVISAERLPEYERRLRVVNLRNEADGRVSVRYLAENAGEAMALRMTGAGAEANAGTAPIPAAPRLEDLYLWLFPQDMAHDATGEQRKLVTDQHLADSSGREQVQAAKASSLEGGFRGAAGTVRTRGQAASDRDSDSASGQKKGGRNA